MKFEVKDKSILIIFIIALISLNLFYFPKIYASGDESAYLKNSYLLQQGNLVMKDPEYACGASPTDNGFVIGRFIGKSIFLIPFTWLGLMGIMLSGLVTHLINFFLIYLILRKLKYNPLNSLLYLFVPVIVWESRTLYTEILALTFLLAAFYFYVSEKNQRHWLYSGLFFGLAMSVRYDAIMGFASFFIPAIIKNKDKAARLIFGFAPIAITIFLLNKILLGSFLSTGYGQSNTALNLFLSIFTNMHIETLVISVFILAIFYPLLIISPYFVKNFPCKLELALFTLSYLLLNATFTDFLVFDLSITSMFSYRLRYLVPLIGLLIVPYANLFEELLLKITKKIRLNKQIAVICIFMLLLLGSAAIAVVHGNFLDKRFELLGQIQKNIPEKSLTIGSADDCMYFISPLFGDRKYVRVDLSTDFSPKYSSEDIYSLIDEQLKQNNLVYIMDLYYSNILGNAGSRKTGTIDKERAKIKEFIEKNKNNLTLVYETEKPHVLNIYKFSK